MFQHPDFDENGFYRGRFTEAIRAENKRSAEAPASGNDSKKQRRAYITWNEEQELFLVNQVMKHKSYIKTNEKKEDKLKRIVKSIQESPLFDDVKNLVVST